MASERKGLEEQLKLLIEKANRIRADLATAVDPSVKFKLEQDLIKVEAEIRDKKAQLNEAFDFHFSEGESMLKEKIRRLNLEGTMGIMDLVNCDRVEMTERFWDAFDERDHHHFQFYFICACPTQMPLSFSEYMVYQIIEEELEDQDDALLCHRKDNSDRIRIYDLPMGRNLENSQKKFRKFFSEYFKFADDVVFEDYIRTGLPKLNFEYVALVFEIHERDWKDFLPEYLRWILSTFTHTHADVPHFLLFFIVHVENLHAKDESANTQLAQLKTLVEAEPPAALLTPLLPVPEIDLKKWFQDRGERNPARIEEVIDTMVKGLKEQDQKQYFSTQRLNMDDIEIVQEITWQVFNEKRKSR